MKDRDEIDELTLHAYLDGELDPVRSIAVEEWLKAHPAEQARLESWRKHEDMLRAVLNQVAGETVPTRLHAALCPRSRRIRFSLAAFSRAAAAVVLLALGLAGGWSARDYLANGRGYPDAILAARALDAHIVYAADFRHPVEVMASEHEHLNAWLSRRLQRQISAPDLTSAGYSLMGGRLLSDQGKPAALFMYEDVAGKRLTVLVAQAGQPGEMGPKLVAREDLRTMSWSEGPLTLAVTGNLDSDRLRGIGELVRTSVQIKG